MKAFLESIADRWKPHAGQREFLLESSNFKVLACGRRWGKTDACAVDLVHGLTQSSPAKHLVVAPTVDQARLLFERVLEVLSWIAPEEKPKVTRTPYPKLVWRDHVLQARSGHLGHALRGQEATHVVIDEAAFVPESLVTEVVFPMLATTGGKLTLISTPRGRNHFWRFFQMGQDGENQFWSRTGPSAENPRVNASFLQIQRELLSDRAFRVEYLAEFSEGAERIFRSDSLERCLVPFFGTGWEGCVQIGIDWARYSDRTAIAVVAGDRDSCRLVELEYWTGVPWQIQVEKVAEIVRMFPGAVIRCDATGVGDPVMEMLKGELPEFAIHGVVFNRVSKENLIQGLAWMFERGALKMLPHVELLKELEHFEAQQSPSGHVQLAASAGYHDDLVCALALAVMGLPRPYRATLVAGQPRRFHRAEKQ